MSNETFKHLANTISLIDGKTEIAELVRNQTEINCENVNEKIRNYNCQLIDEVKTRLANYSGQKVNVNH